MRMPFTLNLKKRTTIATQSDKDWTLDILTEFANDDCLVPRSHSALPRRNLLITVRLASRDHILQMSAAQRVGNLFV